MRRLVFILPLAVFAGLAIVFAIMLLSGRDPSIIPSALIDKPVPQFTLPAIEGLDGIDGFATADVQGDVILVNIFASWCLPCLAEHPLITALATDGHRVFGINYRDEAPAAVAWLERNGNPYQRAGLAPEARVSLDWGVTGVPETFVVDASGRIRYKHTGPLTPEAVKKEILPALLRAATP